MSPLVKVTIASIYKHDGVEVALPSRMALATPDTKAALEKAGAAVKAKGGRLVLSDLFRSYEMQLGSHMDFVSGKKKAFSPAPGGSLHEGGRAFDLDLKSLKMSLADFWEIAAATGLSPIIASPNPKTSEAWHFECRGSHTKVYDYYKGGKGTNFPKPYQAMAASSIVSVGVKVDKFGAGQQAAYIQSALIRLGHDIGNLDGQIGPKTRDGLDAVGIATGSPAELVEAVDDLLQRAFPGEFFDASAATSPFG